MKISFLNPLSLSAETLSLMINNQITSKPYVIFPKKLVYHRKNPIPIKNKPGNTN